MTAPGLYLLHVPEAISFLGLFEVPVPRPEESHRWFGAVFLFLGSLLCVESLTGSLWHRSRFRSLIWPVSLVLIGAGLFLVSLIDPKDRLIHAILGALLILAGWLESRYRLRQIPRSTADLLVLPAALVAAFEVGVIHAHGATPVLVAHVIMGATGIVLAGARAYQSRLPQSLPRSALFAAVILLLGVQLLAHPAVEG
ncbi:MAG: hypothetical protein GEU28_06155 [Dehalococcoidia bacterium]|nr:hypothetical protein [Dehalococcoidia bacterium]